MTTGSISSIIAAYQTKERKTKMKYNNIGRSRKFNFGKVAYWPTSRKSNAVEVEISLRELDNGQLEFSAMGEIWNCRRTDCLSGGQNLDTIHDYIKNDAVFNEIYDIWNNFHLNGLNSGTRKQEAALVEESDRRNAEHKVKGEKLEEPLTYANRYDDACKYLKSIGLYIDKLGDGEMLNCERPEEGITSNHYPYGRGWITRVLSERTLKRIRSLLDKGEVYRESEV